MAWLGALALMAGVIGLVLVLGWQVIQFLQLGEWTSVSIVTGLNMLDSEWAESPEQWIGLHGILDFVNLGVGLFLAGLALAGFFGSMED